MGRTKSSSLARIADLAKGLMAEVDNAVTEHDILLTASERLKEIEPALKKLQVAFNPPVTPAPENQPPGDQPPGDQPPITNIPKERAKRIRKKIIEPDIANIQKNPN